MVSSVLVVDDSVFMRSRLKQLLDGEHEVVGEAENGAEAVERYRELEPDVVTIDVVMPIRNGVEATTEIKALDPDSSIVVCTAADQTAELHEAVDAGADSYVTKPFRRPEVLRAIDDATNAAV